MRDLPMGNNEQAQRRQMHVEKKVRRQVAQKARNLKRLLLLPGITLLLRPSGWPEELASRPFLVASVSVDQKTHFTYQFRFNVK